MQFDFFTLGGRFFWEDVFNYQNWRIQRNTRTRRYRLLDSYNIKRAAGNFLECKNTLLKYIEACELDEPYDDTIILLHGFGRTDKSLKHIIDSLKDIKANIIAVHYASLRKDLTYQANLLEQFFKNMEIKGNLYFINVGISCLILRKLLAASNNYRKYKISRILDINPLNSGSDLAEILQQYKIFRFVLGPLLKDISTQKAMSLAKLPKDIPHGIIFCPSTFTVCFKKLLSRLDSFPNLTPPSEYSYANNVCTISKTTLFPLQNPQLLQACRKYITEDIADSHQEKKEKR